MDFHSSSRNMKIVLGVVAIALVVFAVKFTRWEKIQPDKNLYQVVLLRNDQAFYGKLHNVRSQYVYLTDVYYLNPQAASKQEGSKFTVIKRGIDEIHQPTDALYIPRENITYWENVGPDSLVTRGIKADKEYRRKQSAKPAEKAPDQPKNAKAAPKK